MVAGYPFYKAALLGLRHCALGMDLLVVTATTIAYIYSVTVVILDSVIDLDYDNFFDSIPLLLMFISFGRLLEHIAKVCVCREMTIEWDCSDITLLYYSKFNFHWPLFVQVCTFIVFSKCLYRFSAIYSTDISMAVGKNNWCSVEAVVTAANWRHSCEYGWSWTYYKVHV